MNQVKRVANLVLPVLPLTLIKQPVPNAAPANTKMKTDKPSNAGKAAKWSIFTLMYAVAVLKLQV